jgi:zinc protease
MYRRSLVPLLASLVALLFCTSSPFAAIKDQVTEKVLSNGLKVIVLENHKVPQVTFLVVYRVGSRNEEFGRTGLSHMLEHMMFKGTEKVGPEEFSRIIQENGGQDNAFTSTDFTAYFENLASDRIDVAIDLESDRMANLILREEDFLPERSVVMEERRLRTDDNPRAVLAEQLEATAFQIQPYRWPVIGWMQDIERFTLQDLKGYHGRYYVPANAFLAVVGDVNPTDLFSKLETSFGPIPSGTAPEQRRDRDPQQLGERRIIVKKEAQLPSVVMAYHVPNIEEKDSYVLEVVSSLLSAGDSSRLHRRIVREKQLARSVDADYSLLSKDPSLFSFTADPLPGKELQDVERALEVEIERLQKEPVTAQELQKAKNQLEAAFLFGQDSLFFQALLLAQYEITPGWRAVDDYIPSIRAVSGEDIRRVAGRYFIPDNRTVAVLIPLPLKEGKAAPLPPSGKERIVR